MKQIDKIILYCLIIPIISLLFYGCSETEDYIMPDEHMFPYIRKGEKVLIMKNAYKDINPNRWDVILYNNPITNEKTIHRIIGLPNETIEFKKPNTFIDGKMLPMPILASYEAFHNNTLMAIISLKGKILTFPAPAGKKESKNVKIYESPSYPLKIPDNSYFVLSDCSPSIDSIYFGALKIGEIIGKVQNSDTLKGFGPFSPSKGHGGSIIHPVKE